MLSGQPFKDVLLLFSKSVLKVQSILKYSNDLKLFYKGTQFHFESFGLVEISSEEFCLKMMWTTSQRHSAACSLQMISSDPQTSLTRRQNHCTLSPITCSRSLWRLDPELSFTLNKLYLVGLISKPVCTYSCPLANISPYSPTPWQPPYTPFLPVWPFQTLHTSETIQ